MAGMGMPFRFNRTARESPKRRRCLREWEPSRTRARSCRIDALSGGRSSPEHSRTLFILSLADGTIPSPGVHLPRHWDLGFFGRALRSGKHGDGTIALASLATRSIVRLFLRSTNSARTSPIFSKGAGYCVIRWAFGRSARFLHIVVTLAFFLPTSQGNRS
jgi:hypothetical protein